MNAGMAAALLVHALDEQAKAFYLAHGFIESPIEPMTLMLSLAQTAASAYAESLSSAACPLHPLPSSPLRQSPIPAFSPFGSYLRSHTKVSKPFVLLDERNAVIRTPANVPAFTPSFCESVAMLSPQ